jgi:hypothetical protein
VASTRVAATMEVSMAPPSPAAVRSSRVLPPWKIQHVQRSTVMRGAPTATRCGTRGGVGLAAAGDGVQGSEKSGI